MGCVCHLPPTGHHHLLPSPATQKKHLHDKLELTKLQRQTKRIWPEKPISKMNPFFVHLPANSYGQIILIVSGRENEERNFYLFINVSLTHSFWNESDLFQWKFYASVFKGSDSVFISFPSKTYHYDHHQHHHRCHHD